MDQSLQKRHSKSPKKPQLPSQISISSTEDVQDRVVQDYPCLGAETAWIPEYLSNDRLESSVTAPIYIYINKCFIDMRARVQVGIAHSKKGVYMALQII